ncbi:carbohydrate-binding domain-containing protein, partial [Methylobacterium sp. J-067]|uniref:carbohydrate-binding domain-containing protein n=1 Tax=Methylobacterium sp. J-067 TaxID=2836648 RepID=UPI0024440D62
AGGKLSLLGSGAQSVTVHDVTAIPAPAPAASPVTPFTMNVGTGSDTLVLKVSQDAYNGDAQYTVSVDGKQVGGTLTAHASHASGQSDTITVNGDWAAGDHKVSINFLNDAFGGTAATDRNLYLDSATYDGAAVTGGKLSLLGSGAQTVTVHDTTAIPAPASSLATPFTMNVGTGSDTLVLKVSQDAYKGDAQYTISVDGKQIGGTLTAHAAHASGQSDTITVNGDWAVGDHKVSINFLNDAFGGTAATDRNLYLDSATYDGAAVAGGKLSMLSSGAQTVTVHDVTAIPTLDLLHA